MSRPRLPAVVQLRDLRALLVMRFTAWFAMSALTVVVGYRGRATFQLGERLSTLVSDFPI